MPTFETTNRFGTDHHNLDNEGRARFRVAVENFIDDLKSGQGFRPGLRVKGVANAEGVFEMSWAPDGRATFEYGQALVPGESHIIWRRVGSHDIFGTP